MLGQLFDELLAHARVETGDEGVLVDEEHGLALNGLPLDRQRQVDAPIHEYLEQEIFAAAIGLDVIDRVEKTLLRGLIWRVEDVGHVRGIDLKDAKAVG